MSHFVHHWLNNPPPPEPKSHFPVGYVRRAPGWVIQLRSIPPIVHGIVGPRSPGRERGYHERNLQHQLEARARNDRRMLTWEDWISLSPYLRPTYDGGFSWIIGDREGIDDRRYEDWLDVWFGHHGAEAAIELRNQVMLAIEDSLNMRQVPWHRGLRAEEDTQSDVLSRCFVTEAWLASGNMFKGVVRSLNGRVWVDSEYRVRVLGRSSLVWILAKTSYASPGQEYGIRVYLEGTGHTFCIQPEERHVHGMDLLGLYMLGLANDIESSYRISTLSNGLSEEQAMVRDLWEGCEDGPEPVDEGYHRFPGLANFFRKTTNPKPPNWMVTTEWAPLTADRLEHVR